MELFDYEIAGGGFLALKAAPASPIMGSSSTGAHSSKAILDRDASHFDRGIDVIWDPPLPHYTKRPTLTGHQLSYGAPRLAVSAALGPTA